jgi:hypothetical protein
MILHLQCVPLLAISAAYDPDSARTPFIPLNQIPGHDDRSVLALFAGKGWGVGWESRIVICDGLGSPSDDLSAQREVSSFG